MCRFKNKGQISMEFLVILLATVAILLVFMPVFGKLQNTIVFALDVYNASDTLSDLKTDVALLDSLAEGSSFEISFNFVKPVKFQCSGNKASFTLVSGAKTKILSADLHLDCSFDANISKHTHYILEKQSPTYFDFVES